MRNLAILALLLAVGGCKIEQTGNYQESPDSSASSDSSSVARLDSLWSVFEDNVERGNGYYMNAPLGDTIIGGVRFKRTRSDQGDEVGYRAVAADTMRRNARTDTVRFGTSYAAAKVAAVMAAEGITLPQVVAYLYAYGWDVVPAPMPDWTWTEPVVGSPVAYYVWEMRGVVSGTRLLCYLPNAAGNTQLRVRGVDAQQRVGPWSLVGVNGDGTLLPGVSD